MKRFLNRLSTADKVTIMLKILAISTLVLLMSSCSSLQFKFNTLNTMAYHETLHTVQQPNVTVYRTTHQVFSNMDPWDFGLHAGGNWIHCRHHGFHDLNDWTDFSYSPYFCRPSHGFLSGSQWNSNWGGMNHWNNNWMWNPRNQYDYWGSNWSPWMGNAHYGYYGNYGYYGWNNNNYVPYHWRRSNINSRRNSFSPRLRSTRTNTPTGVIRTRPNRTRVLPKDVKNTRTIIPNNIRTIRTPIRRSDVKLPIRTNTRPINNIPNNARPIRTIKQNEVRQYNTPTRPVNNIRPPVNTRQNTTVPTKRTQNTNTRRKDN